MDLFEEVVKLRREGKRGALATIVHTNGSIPSYESRGCSFAKTARLRGQLARMRRSRSLAPERSDGRPKRHAK